MGAHSQRRFRRLRRTAQLRSLRAETDLRAKSLIQPVFVVENPRSAGPIEAMPGVRRVSLRELPSLADEAVDAGIGALLVFGIPAAKDESATAALSHSGIVALALRELRTKHRPLALMTDVCLCSYLSHGHCGIVLGDCIDNDQTLPLVAQMAVVHAQAGADVVAPSGMMDGAVSAIRTALSESGHDAAAILSYSAKYASSFYGPFREAAESSPKFGDRRSYQMDPCNGAEAVEEARTDLEEGADMLMVKPGLPYLDVIRRIKDAFPATPLAAYQVSGEYSMIMAAAERGWIDGHACMMESLLALRRAGADMLISYDAIRTGRRLSLHA